MTAPLKFRPRAPTFRVEVDEMYCAPQGEGPNLGRPSLFVRFHGCPLSCRWCDTRFTWDKEHPDFGKDTRTYTNLQSVVGAMLSASAKEQPEGLVLTGGEPMMYQRHLVEIVDEYRNACREGRLREVEVEVETSGALMPGTTINEDWHFNVSHKLATAGDHGGIGQHRLWNQRAAQLFMVSAKSVAFKPVVGEGDETALELYLTWLLEIKPPSWDDDYLMKHVYLMPEGQTRLAVATNQRLVIQLAQRYGTRVTTRMHVTAFNDERKR